MELAAVGADWRGPCAIGVVGNVSGMVWDTPPAELERLNNLALKDMGIDKDTRLEFFAAEALTPTTQTISSRI